MVGNTQIDLSNYVQKTDYATSSNAGVVKVETNSGLTISNGSLKTLASGSTDIKTGAELKKPIVPATQHNATFYGLAKAAGDTTQSQSANAVGTYTDEAKAAIQQMLDVPSTSDIPDTSIYATKESIDNAGITDRTYVTELNGEFTVTTVASQDYNFPYARANVTGRFNKENQYRVTINEVEYILSTRLWYIVTSSDFKVYEYLGNLGLYISDISGVPGGTDDVPFIIISDIDDHGSIDVLTNSAGTYTILIEKIVNTQTKIPNTLIYGDNYTPIEKNNNSGTYNGFSIGVNELTNKRGTIAIGYGNKITSNFSTAIGIANEVSGGSSVVLGNRSKATGLNSYAEGYQNIASGDYSHAEGVTSTASGSYSHAETGGNTASGNSSHAEGYSSIASGDNSHAEGYKTQAAGSSSHSSGLSTKANAVASFTQGINSIANKVSQSVFGKNNVMDESSDSYGKYSFIIGNGASSSARSNAYALDWDGTGHYMGDVYVGANADSSGGEKLVRESEVLFEKGTGIGSVKTKDFVFGGMTFSNEANGLVSYAEGLYTVSSGQDAHAEGYSTKALGMHSHTEGLGTIASGVDLHVSGTYNVDDSYESLPEWESGVSYAVGDKVKITTNNSDNTVKITGYICKTANSDIEFTRSNWSSNPKLNYAEIIGNGSSESTRSNAYALSWNGDGHYAGDVYVHSNADSTGGTKLATIEDIPSVPVSDVQVNGSSVVTNGVANVPIADTNTYGVAKIYASNGINIDSNGRLTIYAASETTNKAGNNWYRPIVSAVQQSSTFYGLAKAAGYDEKNSTLPVGQYTDAAKAAIQSMLGVSQMLAPVNPNMTAEQAYAIGDVFAANGKLYKATAAIAQDGAIIPDTNCVETTMADESVRDVQVNGVSVIGSNGVAAIPLATSSQMGVVSVGDYGISVSGANNTLVLSAGAPTETKTGTNIYRPVVVGRQHQSVFYGLSKVAGVDLANETVTLGTYPEASKTAIKAMLGVEEGLKVVRLI